MPESVHIVIKSTFLAPPGEDTTSILSVHATLAGAVSKVEQYIDGRKTFYKVHDNLWNDNVNKIQLYIESHYLLN